MADSDSSTRDNAQHLGRKAAPIRPPKPPQSAKRRTWGAETINQRLRNAATVDQRGAQTVDQRHRNDATVDQRGAQTVDQRHRNDATVDQRGTRARTGRLRTILPSNLLARFTPLQNLNVTAGQADLVLCKDKATGEQVVVKLYRNAAQLDREVLAKLYQANSKHVVRLIDHGNTDGEPWEVQEYCSLGTLTDYRLKHGGKLSHHQVRQIVIELATAIDHIHSLGITHRDMKPENILVRSLSPLDLVLTDFGVAAEQIATVQLQTVAASWAWAAPEVHTKGVVSFAVDWWALGAIIYQMLVGHHLLAGPDGKLPADEKQLRASVADGLYVTHAISDPTWRNLVDGLLSYQPAQRWRFKQVASWLAGGSPAVVRTVPIAELGQVRETRALKYVFNGHPVRTGRELVTAMRQDWKAAGDLLSGRLDPSLESWLNARPDGANAVKAIKLERTGGARFIRLQAELDPGGPLEYRGLAVTGESLNRAISQANSWKPGATGQVASYHDWLKGIRQESVLRAMAAVVEGKAADRLGHADQLLNTWSKQTRAVLDAIPSEDQRKLAQAKDQAMLAFMFSVALGSTDSSQQAAQAQALIKDRDTDGKQWANDLANKARSARLSDLGFLFPAAAVISSVTADNRARKQREKAEKEAKRRRLQAERERKEREEREREEQRQRAERERVLKKIEDDRKQRAWRRRQRLKSQLPTRVSISVIYSFIFGVIHALTIPNSRTVGWEIVWHFSKPILTVCLITVALSLIVDWVLDNPDGVMREFTTTVGVLIGVSALIEYFVKGPEFGTSGDSRLTVVAWAYGMSWIIGSVLTYVVDRAEKNYPGNKTSSKIEQYSSLRMVPAVIAAITGLSALFVGHCWNSCLAAPTGYFTTAKEGAFINSDMLGIHDSGMLVVILAAAVCVLYIAAPKLAHFSQGLGIGTAIASAFFGFLVYVIFPWNLINAIIGGIMRIAS